MRSSDNLCELHVHIEGCVWPKHMQRWWRRAGHLFPAPCMNYACPFDTFLAHLRFGYNFLNAPEAYAAVAGDYAQHAIEAGIRYAELQINVVLVQTYGLTLADVVRAIRERVEALPGAPCIRFILDLPWQFAPEQLLSYFDNLPTLRKLGVVGIGFGGDERLAEPERFVPAVEVARKAGMKVLAHAGETSDPVVAQHIVETLQPNRIGHGVAIASWLGQLGADAPPIDVCLTSNRCLGIVSDVASHPLRNWVDAGVRVSLSTDDPALFGVSLVDEYRLATNHIPLWATSNPYPAIDWPDIAFDREACRRSLAAQDESV